jgi:hypothetical protein
MLCFLLCVAAPAQAGTIEFVDVVHTLGGVRQTRPANEIRLRIMTQSGAVADQNPSAQSNATSSTQQQQQPDDVQSPASQQTGTTEGTLSQSGGTVETIDLGDVTGTVCDCGVIPIPDVKGGFPKWPLFALAAIPLGFIPGGDDDNTPPSFPTPTPPDVPIPEPATLLLFGSGLLALGARARRRYGRQQQQPDGETVTLAEEV